MGAKGREFAQKYAPAGMAASFAAVYAQAVADAAKGLAGAPASPEVRRRSTST
jgi:hypothetical protein